MGKSIVMRFSNNGGASRIGVRLNGELLEEVQCFKYLGSQVEKMELVETEVKSRVKEGCKVLGALKSVMSCRTLGMEAKRGLYEFDAAGITVEALPELVTLRRLYPDDSRLGAAVVGMASSLIEKCTDGTQVKMGSQPNQLSAVPGVMAGRGPASR